MWMLTCLCPVSPVSSKLLEERAVSGLDCWQPHPLCILYPHLSSLPTFLHLPPECCPRNQMWSYPSLAQTGPGLQILTQQEDGKSLVPLRERETELQIQLWHLFPLSLCLSFSLCLELTYFPPVIVWRLRYPAAYSDMAPTSSAGVPLPRVVP